MCVQGQKYIPRNALSTPERSSDPRSESRLIYEFLVRNIQGPKMSSRANFTTFIEHTCYCTVYANVISHEKIAK